MKIIHSLKIFSPVTKSKHTPALKLLSNVIEFVGLTFTIAEKQHNSLF